jgi:N-acetylglucosamine repressor
LAHADPARFAKELRDTADSLGIAVAAVINLFNPATVFIHTKLFAADPALFPRMVEQAGKRALPPSFADCRIVPAKGHKNQGAVAGIIQHLTNAVVPGTEFA